MKNLRQIHILIACLLVIMTAFSCSHKHEEGDGHDHGAEDHSDADSSHDGHDHGEHAEEEGHHEEGIHLTNDQ